MNEQTQLKAFLAFLFIFTVMALSQAVHAAAVAVPTVAGYSAGSFSAAAGSFTTAANAASYGATGVVNVGGKAITVPATLRMASNAGQFAKNAMKLNPWAIAGTLAAGYLLDHLMSLDENGDWQVYDDSNGTYPLGYTWRNGYANNSTISTLAGVFTNICGSTSSGCSIEHAANFAAVFSLGFTYTNAAPVINSCTPASQICNATVSRGAPYNSPVTGNVTVTQTTNPAPDLYRPATDDDWDALPDSLPDVAPELPYAPYMPNGAPVEAPEYDFAPFSAPLGDPYTKPDGSTAQPMAKVSPNGDSVTIDTYDQPLTDPNGDPVPNPTPQDTPEPTQSECERHPSTIGCAEFGNIPAPDLIPETVLPADATVTPIGGSGSCPADVTTTRFGLTWSYLPICNFADAVRPFILGFAWIAFAYIVAGAVRT